MATEYQPYIATHNSFWTKIKNKSPPKSDKDSTPRGIYCQTPTPTISRPSTSTSTHRDGGSKPSHSYFDRNHSQVSLTSKMSRSRSQSQTSLASGGGSRRNAFDSSAARNAKLSLFPHSQSSTAVGSISSTPQIKTPRASEETVVSSSSLPKTSLENTTTLIACLDVPMHDVVSPIQPTITPPPPFTPTESPVIFPDYTTDFFLENNPVGSKADFVVFRPRYRLRSDQTITHDGTLPPATDARLWESGGIQGHKYEVTPYGTLIYYGPFSDSLHTRASLADTWASHNGVINSVKDLNTGRYVVHEAGEDYYPKEIPVRCKAVALDMKSTSNKNITGTWTRLWGRTTYACAAEDKPAASATAKTPTSARSPTSPSMWQHAQPRSVRIYCSVAWLVAAIIAQGTVEPKDVGKYLYADKYVSYERHGRTGAGAPNWSIPLIRLRVPLAKADVNIRDAGWLYTERKGLEVLVG